MPGDPLREPAGVRETALQRLIDEAARLPLKLRLRLIDALKSDATLERDDGIRFSMESLAEYKRGRRRQEVDASLDVWMSTFTGSDVFFDVGANTGSVSLRAALLHQGRVPVFAFEPAFDTFGALVRNVAANNMAHVITPLHVALFDETGIRPFHRSSLGAGTALHAVGEPLDFARRPFVAVAVEPVLAFRLDDLIATFGLPQPTRIKLDVDGFEHKVLAGAAGALAASRCEIYVELVEAAQDDPHPRQLSRFLEGLGYRLTQVAEHRPAGTYPRISDALFVRG